MTNEAKHTPGPWLIFEPYMDCIRSADKTTIATTDNANKEANARLIAAAPDLLEALEMLLEGYGPNAGDDVTPVVLAEFRKNALNKTRAAIAKATGRAA